MFLVPRLPFRASFAFAILLALTSLAPASVAARRGAPPLDLPAMALRTTDFMEVGHDGFGQDAGDVFGRQGCFESADFIELDCLGEGGQILRLANKPRVGTVCPVGRRRDKGLIDRTMIASIENEYLLAASYGAAPAQDRPIGVGGGCRDLPIGQVKAFRQKPADDGCIG